EDVRRANVDHQSEVRSTIWVEEEAAVDLVSNHHFQTLNGLSLRLLHGLGQKQGFIRAPPEQQLLVVLPQNRKTRRDPDEDCVLHRLRGEEQVLADCDFVGSAQGQGLGAEWDVEYISGSA